IERPHDVAPYLCAIVASIFVNYALAWLISRLNATNAIAGLKVALVCWFAFLFVEYATISAFSAFETNPWPLVFINMGRPFVAFLLHGNHSGLNLENRSGDLITFRAGGKCCAAGGEARGAN